MNVLLRGNIAQKLRLGSGLVREALDEMRSYYGQMLRSGATTTGG